MQKRQDYVSLYNKQALLFDKFLEEVIQIIFKAFH